MFVAPAVCEVEPVTANYVAEPVLTLTVKRSAPLVVIAPWVATMLAVSTLYSVIERPVVLATPLVNVSAVSEPKLIALLELFVTVGVVAGLLEALAPEKVMLWLPV